MIDKDTREWILAILILAAAVLGGLVIGAALLP